MRNAIVLMGLIMTSVWSSVALSQEAILTDDAPPAAFLAEPFCFVTEWGHQGEPGFGPILRVVVPPLLQLNSAKVYGSGQLRLVGDFPIDLESEADTTLIDPLTDLSVTGSQGHRYYNLLLPFGSVVEDEPALPIDLCLTIDPEAPLGEPLSLSLTPVYQFGDVATGDNGALVGEAVALSIQPSVVLFEKSNSAPEWERPPGPSWPYRYLLTANIADSAILPTLRFEDQLPDDFFLQSVEIMGGNDCAVLEQPEADQSGGTVVVRCDAPSIGTVDERDVQVRLTGYFLDLLDDQSCAARAITNTATLQAEYQDLNNTVVALPALTDPSTVTARHVAIQKSANPKQLRPGEVVQYRHRLQISDYVSVTDLVVEDVLGDGIDLLPSTLSLRLDDRAAVAVPASAQQMVINSNGSTTLTIDLLAALGAQSLGGGSALTLQYQGQVRQRYRASDAPVLASDRISNQVQARYDLLSGPSQCTQGSSASITITPVGTSKSVVNPQARYEPGESVIYRLRMNIPSGDTRDIEWLDFLPLPVLKVEDLDLRFSLAADDCPEQAGLCLGPNDNLGLTPTSVRVDNASNALIIEWPDVSEVSAGAVIEMDVHTTVTDAPFADGLFLTNVMQGVTRNTQGEVQASAATVEVQVGAPELVLSKAVVGSSGDGLIADGNLRGAQAADRVDFRLTVDNVGGAPAYDLQWFDVPAAGLRDCGSVQVRDAMTDTILTSTGDLFSASNPLTIAGPLAKRVGESVPRLWVDYTCTVDVGVQPEQVLRNTSTLNYRALPDGPSYPEQSAQAQVSIASVLLQKSLVASSEPHSDDDLSPPRLTIGEIARYRLITQLPRSSLPNMEVRDLLPSGLQFLNDGSTKVALVSSEAGALTSSSLSGAGLAITGNDPDITPSLVLPSSAISPSTFGSSTDPRFNLGDVVHSGPGEAWVVLEFNALILNQSNNQSGRNRPNQFEVSVDGQALSATSNVHTLRLAEPAITLSKNVTPALADAGDPVTFSIDFRVGSSINQLDAFEVKLTDQVPELIAIEASSLALDVSDERCGQPTVNAQLDVGTGEIEYSFDRLPSGCTGTLTYQGVLSNAVEPGTVIENVAELSWSSLPGGGTANNPTGSDVPGAPGEVDGERQYRASAAAQIAVTGFELLKRVAGSDNPFTASSQLRRSLPDVTIGETVHFEIAITVPEGTTPSLVVRDTLPFSQGLMEVVDARLVSLGDDLTRSGASIGNNPPLISQLDAKLKDGVIDTVVFDFGEVINPANGAGGAAAKTIVEVQAVVLDQAENQSGNRLRNTALLKFGDGLSASARADVDVVEPLLRLFKEGSLSEGDAGDVVTFTVTLAHQSDSTADAHDVLISDVLPASFQPVSDSLLLLESPEGCDASQADRLVEVVCERLALGDRVKLSFDAAIDVSVSADQVIRNRAEASWSSMPGTTATQQRLYSQSASHALRITAPGVSKTVIDTNNPDTGQAPFTDRVELTIGEQVTYEVVVTLPEGSHPALTVRDQLPIGSSVMEVLSGELHFIGARLSGGEALAVGNPGQLSDSNGDGILDRIEWSLGDVINAPDNLTNRDDALVFRVQAVVRDAPLNQSGVRQQINTARVSTLTASPRSATAAVDMVAPRLSLDKAVLSPDPAEVDAGDVVTYRLTLRHDARSTAPAYAVRITDLLPMDDFVWGNSVVVERTCPGLQVTGDEAKVFTIDQLDLDVAECHIDYQATVAQTVQPGQRLVNTAILQYDSMPEFVAGQTRRLGDQASAEVTVGAPTLSKRVISSSLATTGSSQHTGLVDLAVGERVTYAMTIHVIEGEISSARLVDELPISEDGLTLIEALGAKVVALGANLSTSEPGLAVLSDRSGDGLNDTVELDFGTVVNVADNISRNDQIVVEVVARVVDGPDNADAAQLRNVATFSYASANSAAQSLQSQSLLTVESDASIELVEPALTLTKTMGPVQQGVVTIRLGARNEGTAPAYDLLIEDVLDEAVWDVDALEVVSVTEGFLVDVVAGPASGQQTLRVRSDSAAANVNFLAVGSEMAAALQLPLRHLSPSPNPLPNEALLSACSVPAGCGDHGSGRLYDNIRAEDTIALPALILDKTVALRLDADQSGDVSPGDTVRYTLTLRNMGAAAAHELVLSDAPDPLSQLVAGSVTTSVGRVVVGNSDNDQSVQVNLPQLDADQTVVVRFDVRLPNSLPQGVESITNQAVLDSAEWPPVLSQDPDGSQPDGATELLINAVPELTLSKTLLTDTPADIAPGALLRYQLSYLNRGSQDASGVVLTETVPEFTRFEAAGSSVGWVCAPDAQPGSVCQFTVGDVAVGETGEVNFAVRVDERLPVAVDALSNTASIRDDGDNSTVPSNDRDQLVSVLSFTPAMTLSKTLLSATPSPAQFGSVLRYELLVRNVGNQALTRVGISDPLVDPIDLAADCTWPDTIGTLLAGASARCLVDYTVTIADSEAGVVTNTASASSDQTVPVSAQAEVDIAAQPAITLDKAITDGSPYVNAGDQITYALTATNTGSVTLSEVRIEDPLASVGVCTPSQPAQLAPGESLVCPATYTVSQADVDAREFINIATVTGVDREGTVVSAVGKALATDPTAAPAIDLVKTITRGDPYAVVGETIEYELTAINTGNVTLLNTVISDPSAVLGECQPAQPAVLAPGETLQCVASVVIAQADIDAGLVSNVAVATAQGPAGRPVEAQAEAVATGPVAAPDIGLVKTITSGSPYRKVGDVIRYVITATNTGNVTLSGMLISDPLAQLELCTPAMPAAIAPGQSLSCEARYVVVQADLDAGQFVNTASVTGTDPNGTKVTAEDSAIAIDPDAVASIVLSKVADTEGPVAVDEVITYTLTATNTGEVTLDSVLISDDMIALTCDTAQPARLAPTEQLVCAGSYVVSMEDVGSSLINEASVQGQTLDGRTVTDEASVSVPVVQPLPVPVNQRLALMVLILLLAALGVAASRRFG